MFCFVYDLEIKKGSFQSSFFFMQTFFQISWESKWIVTPVLRIELICDWSVSYIPVKLLILLPGMRDIFILAMFLRMKKKKKSSYPSTVVYMSFDRDVNIKVFDCYAWSIWKAIRIYYIMSKLTSALSE